MSMEIGLGTPTGVRRTWHLSGVLALAGGALMVTGAFLPWLSVFEGLQTIRGVAGPNGRMLAIAGAGALLLGAVLAVRGGKRLGSAIAVLGAIAAAFAGYLVAQLLVAMEGLDGMVLAKLGPGLFVSTAGTLLVAGSILAPDRSAGSAERAPRELAGAAGRSRARAVTNAVALASAAAGVIHLSVAPDHFREFLAFGVFFVVAGVAQLAWAGLVWTRPNGRLLLAGAVANALVVLLWIVSRSSGLPIGPERWSPEAMGFADIVCSAFEVVLVAGALFLRRSPDRELGARTALLARIAPVAVGVPLTVAAVLSGTGALLHMPMHM